MKYDARGALVQHAFLQQLVPMAEACRVHDRALGLLDSHIERVTIVAITCVREGSKMPSKDADSAGCIRTFDKLVPKGCATTGILLEQRAFDSRLVS